MKPKEYVKKYKLDVDDNFDHNQFMEDFKFDFIALLEVGKGMERSKGFENTVRAVRMKWDSINNKTRGQLPEKLWGYFYATTVAKMREELFPEMAEHRREQQERRKEQQEYHRRRNDRERSFFDDFFILGMFARMNVKPIESFVILGLDASADQQQVKTAYRKASLKHHPDVGGNKEGFLRITDAKNKCLAYLGQQ
jgi:hypothetical protein